MIVLLFDVKSFSCFNINYFRSFSFQIEKQKIVLPIHDQVIVKLLSRFQKSITEISLNFDISTASVSPLCNCSVSIEITRHFFLHFQVSGINNF